MDNKLKYNEPWIMQREQIHMYTDIQTELITLQRRYRNTTGLYLENQIRLQDLRQQLRLKSGTSMRTDRRAYIYGRRNFIICLENGIFTMQAVIRMTIWAIRPYVLECQGDDPVNDEWIEKGKMQRAGGDEFSFEAFSLDATVFKE